PTGETVEVTVTARDMAYEPDVIEANPGDRLVITMVNADTQVHDLRLATGEDTGRVAPGDSATIDPILDAAPDTDVHEITLRVSEFTGYAAPGIEQEHWVFNGAPLGPTLRGKV